MPRLSNPIYYGPAEVLYAAADSLARTTPGSARATQLKDRIEQFIREDHLRQLLSGGGVRIDQHGDDTVNITLADDSLSAGQRDLKLELVTAAFRGVADDVRDNIIVREQCVTITGLYDVGMDVLCAILDEVRSKVSRKQKEVAASMPPVMADREASVMLEAR